VPQRRCTYVTVVRWHYVGNSCQLAIWSVQSVVQWISTKPIGGDVNAIENLLLVLGCRSKISCCVRPCWKGIEIQQGIWWVKPNTYRGRDQDPNVLVLLATTDGQLMDLYDTSLRTVQRVHHRSSKKEVTIEVLR